MLTLRAMCLLSLNRMVSLSSKVNNIFMVSGKSSLSDRNPSKPVINVKILVVCHRLEDVRRNLLRGFYILFEIFSN